MQADNGGHRIPSIDDLFIIEEYIKARSALRSGDSQLDEDIRTVTGMILLPSIVGRNTIKGVRKYLRTWIPDPNAQDKPITVHVRYHNHVRIPIADFFTALGWFISVTDTEKAYDPTRIKKTFDWYFTRLVLYSKLCYTAMAEIDPNSTGMSSKPRNGYGPATTHILFTIDHPQAAYLDDLAKLVHPLQKLSLSSSLPASAAKGFMADRRAQAAEASFPGLTFYVDTPMGDQPRGIDSKLGHCAETLNVLSQVAHGRTIYALGAALEFKDVKAAFSSNYFCQADNLTEFKQSASKAACENCEIIYKYANVTFVDIAKGIIYGRGPPGYGDPSTLHPKQGWKSVWCDPAHKDVDKQHANVCLANPQGPRNVNPSANRPVNTLPQHAGLPPFPQIPLTYIDAAADNHVLYPTQPRTSGGSGGRHAGIPVHPQQPNPPYSTQDHARYPTQPRMQGGSGHHAQYEGTPAYTQDHVRYLNQPRGSGSSG
ncbi:hypothetical protein BD410DRAFT_864658 [Rickenella mellea]|uniref:Uncharacterized protein n=1 Tax=Rickenella mellea TaxID=50990 RepID=A0A4Y7Q651_9AGAM|nr:hypothetical protein BD410DRAFT_864658 [Rickenella mellea]